MASAGLLSAGTGSWVTSSERTAWDGLLQSPWRFLASSAPWRAMAYLVAGVITSLVVAVVFVVLLVSGAMLLVAVLGAVALLALVLLGVPVGHWERRRVRLVDPAPVEDPHLPVTEPGIRPWLRVRLREQITWRELGWTALTVFGLCWVDLGMLAVTVGLPLLVIATPAYTVEPGASSWFVALAGVALIPVGAYLLTAWAAARATLVRALLGVQDAELNRRLAEVTRSRARLVADFERERAHIEQDLHDGAQRHLVAVSLSLGMARLDIPPGTPGADRVEKAHEHADRALRELRALIRGVLPRVLTDRGLGAAVEDIAGDVPLPVVVEVLLESRLPPEIERTLYFCISELLTNVTRHSGAARARVVIERQGGEVVAEVWDDGRGGVEMRAGRGLAGLADRMSALGGRLAVDSPEGGPTVVRLSAPAERGTL